MTEDVPPAAPLGPHARKRRRRAVLYGIALIALALLVSIAWGVLAAVQTRDDVAAARAALTGIRSGLGSDTGAIESVTTALGQAHTRLRAGKDRMGQPGPWIAARIPILGRSFAAVRDTAAAADAVVVAGRLVVQATSVDAFVADGGVHIASMEQLRSELALARDATSAPLRSLRHLNTSLTPGAVQSGVRQAQSELGAMDATFGTAAELVGALEAMLGRDGPQPMLFALENNAELRGTGGFVSMYAEGTAENGKFSLTGFREVELVADAPDKAVAVDAPAEFREIYGPQLADTTVWKNVNMSPNGPSSWSVLANVAARKLKQRPTVVIAIDVPAMAAILSATGPARLPDGRTISGDNVVEELLVKAYADTASTPGGQSERRRRLRVAADAVIGRLVHGSAKPLPLIRALQRAAAGRHLMLWSADPNAQDVLVRSGLSGAIPAPDPDIAMMTVHNLGANYHGNGNKIDYYARRALDVHVAVGKDSARTTQTWTLRNDAPNSGLPDYVSGGGLTPGRSHNLVRFSIPLAAEHITYTRNGKTLVAGGYHEVGHRLLSDVSVLDPGQSATWIISYTVPLTDRHYGLWVVPQPLVEPATLSVEVVGDGVKIGPQSGGPTVVRGRLEATTHVQARLPAPGAVERVRRWFREPVHIG